MEEPSVLDYLKSIFKDRHTLLAFVRSQLAFRRVDEDGNDGSVPIRPVLAGEIGVDAGQISPAAEPEPVKEIAVRPFPWRSLLALGLALIGQASFEPPDRTAEIGLVFYLFAIILGVWGFLRGDWAIAMAPERVADQKPVTIRLIPFTIGIGFSLVAFASFGHNLFTKTNLALWILGFAGFTLSLWEFRPGAPALLARVRDFLARETWQIRISRWTVLLLLVVATVVFFRVYDINGVPVEPFSDHAEKVLDVFDITEGKYSIFFPRNTGREALQMYLTVAVAAVFGTGISFLSLKIGTVLCGLLTLPYMYLLGEEVGNKRVGLLAMFLTGIAYWPNVISRMGLRFPLYPLFVAPTLFYLLRGLRRRSRNDFILSGLFLGLGLHGYSPFRIVPILVVVAIVLYMVHAQSQGARRQAVIWLSLVVLVSLVVFLPLLRYSMDNPESFGYRTLTRVGSSEVPLPGPWWQILGSNIWNGLRMYNWDNGEIWVHSIPNRPALDIVSGSLFMLGGIFLLVRYIRTRQWIDLFLLVSIPVLQLPSTLSLAFPGENPALNRAAGAFIPAFLVAALALDGILTSVRAGTRRVPGIVVTWSLLALLVSGALVQNYDLVFNQFAASFRGGAWNSSEMGLVIRNFNQVYGTTDSVWIVPFPHWVDTRLPGVWAGIPDRDFALWPEGIPNSLEVSGPKLFIVKANLVQPEANDQASLDILQELYPQGTLSLYDSSVEGHDFWIFLVPAQYLPNP